MPTPARMFTPEGTPVLVNIVVPEYRIMTTEYGPQTVPVMDETGINYLAELIKDKPRTGFDCNILWTGKRRTGKTTAAVKTAVAIDAKLKQSQITFRLADFNKQLKDNPYADPDTGTWPQVVLDEAGFDLYNLDFMKVYQKNLVKKLEVIGLKNQIVHYVLPHRRKLNKSIREEIIAYWINVRGGFGHSRGFAEVRIGEDNIFEENMYWKPLFCFIYGQLESPLWAEYMTKKREFVDAIAADEGLEDEGGARNDARDKIIREYYQYRKLHKDPINQTDLGKIVGLDQRTVSHIVVKEKAKA